MSKRWHVAIYVALALVFAFQAVEHWLGMRPVALLPTPWSWLVPGVFSVLALVQTARLWRSAR